jgi:enoyl-CoA hydratase/carnithine racemase
MRIVGQVVDAEEATEIGFIVKSFVVANRAKQLAHTIKTNESN